MDSSKKVEFLYHYTSIEKLALILRNRTIRLNPLDKMDDLQEGKTSDVKNLGKFVFVSSWTSDSTERIPMWMMYTDRTAGVRIGMKKNPFVRHTSSREDVARLRRLGISTDISPDGTADTFINFGRMIDGHYYCVEAFYKSILCPVVYTNELSLLEPQVSQRTENHDILALSELGKHKSKYWEFQKEWRYRLSFFPMQYNSAIFESSSIQSIKRMIQGTEIPPFRYYDLDIAPKCFADMEIVCSPQMSAGNKIILNALLEKYNPSAKVSDSILTGKI